MSDFKAKGSLQEWATVPLHLLFGFGFTAFGLQNLAAVRNISPPFSQPSESRNPISWRGRLPF